MSNKPEAFNFPLPIDPLRLIYGIRRYWYLFVILPCLLGGIGWFLGGLKAEDRYTVSLQLIKSEVPASVQTSVAGQAFKPRELSDDTLLSTTYSTAVLDRTAKRLDPERSSGEVKSMVEITKERTNSLFYLTAHSRISAEDAVQTVGIWAEEIIRFTDNLQREEARQMETFISDQLDSIERQLQKVNQQILNFAKEYDFVSVDKQTETTLGALENTRMQLIYTQIELEAKDVQIQRYRDELRAQSPLEADLKKKREELTYLRGRYTDENPLVKEKLYEIEYINQQLKATENSETEDLKDFTGSDLGNNLYLEIIGLQNERAELEKRLNALNKRLAEQEEMVDELPSKSLRLSELYNRRNLLIDAQTLLESRRKEASFFETNAPGYWRVFQRPNLNEVSHSSQNIKALLLGFVGTLGGFAISFLAALFWEALQPGLRTPLEVAISTCTLPVLSYVCKKDIKPSWWVRRLFKKREFEENDRELHKFWLSHALSEKGTLRRRYLFVLTEVHDEETVFWKALFDLINAEGKQLIFISVSEPGTDTMTDFETHPAVSDYRTSLEEMHADKNELIFVRMARIPTSEEVLYLKQLEVYYLLNSPSIAERSTTQYRSEIMRKLLGPASGLLIIDHEAVHTLPRIMKWIELLLLNILFSKKSKSDVE